MLFAKHFGLDRHPHRRHGGPQAPDDLGVDVGLLETEPTDHPESGYDRHRT